MSMGLGTWFKSINRGSWAERILFLFIGVLITGDLDFNDITQEEAYEKRHQIF